MVASFVALADVLLTVLSSPVVVTGTNADLVPVGVLVTDVALLREEAARTLCTGMRALPNPLITELPSPVRLTYAANFRIFLRVSNALLTIIERRARTELTAVGTRAVILATVRAEPVIVANALVVA
jgi:hypothetical protein